MHAVVANKGEKGLKEEKNEEDFDMYSVVDKSQQNKSKQENVS